MSTLSEKIHQDKLDWIRRRLEALDKIEAKLKEMRQLAVYAASRSLEEQETRQIQEWINILQAEVKELDMTTAWQQNLVEN